MTEIVLASKSKRRAQILTACGIRHKVIVSNAREISHSRIHSARLVVENARRKAETAAAKAKGGIVLGVDTVVLFAGKNIGKPKTRTQARKMLEAFSGRALTVYTGLYVIDTNKNKRVSGVEKTVLRARRIPYKDIDRYFLKLGPYDKAGGFSIEGIGAIVFDDIRGSYYNVLGLPMGRLAELFRELGYDILDFVI